MTKQLGVARFSTVLRKVLDSTEGAGGTVEQSITPAIVLESDRPEWVINGGGVLCVAGTSVAALAANYTQIALSNPASSGMLLVVESVVGWGDGTAHAAGVRYFDGVASALGFGALNEYTRDSRRVWAGAASGGASVGEFTVLQNTFLSGNLALRWGCPVGYVPVNVPVTPVILGPNSCMIVCSEIVNTVFGCAITWRERPLEQSEARG